MVTGLIDRTNRSLLPVTLAFAGGIGAASHGALPAATVLGAMAIIALTLLWAHFSDRPRAAALLLLPLFFLTGFWHGMPFSRPPQERRHIAALLGETRQDVVLAGTVAEMPIRQENRTRLRLAVDELRLPGLATPSHGIVQLTVGGALRQKLLPGDRLLARARVAPHRSHKVPGAMDYRAFLERQGIWRTGWAETPLHVMGLPADPAAGRPIPLRYLPERLRAHANQSIALLAPSVSVPLYYGLLTGTRNEIPAIVAKQFQTTGATHLLAISGMNLGLVTLLFAGIATWLLSRSTWLLLHLPTRKIALLLALPPLLGYAAITGLQPPAVRSLIMVLVFMAAIFLDRQWCSLNNLAIAALLILLIEPTSLVGASFQLSFAATAAIILAYRLRFPLLMATTEGNLLIRLRAWLTNGITISVIATLATAPLCLFYFNQISLLSPITTLLLTPLLCFWTIPLGLIALALAQPLPLLASHLFDLGTLGITAALFVVEKLAALPWASFFLPTPTPFEVAAGLLTLLALLAWQNGIRSRIALCVLLAILVASPAIRHGMRLADRTSRITFLDVGQGSATVVELPGGKVVLVDGGGMESERFDVGERLIAPFLWGRGIATLDAVVVSHPHTDHWNGLPFVIDRFRPACLWINGDREGEGGFGAMVAQAEAQAIPVLTPKPGEILCQSGAASLNNLVAFHLENPLPAGRGKKSRHPQPDHNNQSLVVQLRHGNQACLLPGDIGAEREAELVRQKGVESTVLLAPHHGSRHSSSRQFIAAVGPQAIVVSAQSGGRAHFPHPEKRKLWREMGIPVLVTGTDGSIGVRLDGKDARVAPLI